MTGQIIAIIVIMASLVFLPERRNKPDTIRVRDHR